MFKEFIRWMQNKIKIDRKRRMIIINQGEVYWCALGENVGDEENGKGGQFRRPVLVFKKFNNNIFWGIPMSTKNKENPYYIKVLLKDVVQSAIISQLRILDTKRLDYKIGYVSKTDFDLIKNKIMEVILYKH
ncbi:MAG: hypothetical protein RJB39_595 [Candidatus Parcubacteria bacterium]